MSKTFFIFPYAQGSESAKLLRDELKGKLILREGSSFKKDDDRVVINWGASDCPASYKALNKDIKGILDKKKFFQRLEGTGLTPKCAYSKLDAADNLGFPILCRTKLTGKDGEGIVIAEKFSQLVEAKLYTQYEDKTSEYRLHVGRGPNGFVLIGAQKKVKKQTPAGPKLSPDPRLFVGDDHGLVWKVNGQPAHIPDDVTTVTKKAFEKFPELDFCAFDVIYNNSTGKAYVLEANSAPMGTPETTRRYGNFFRTLYPDAVPHQDFVSAEAGSGATAATNTTSAAPTNNGGQGGVPTLPFITVEQVTAAQAIINAFIQQSQN